MADVIAYATADLHLPEELDVGVWKALPDTSADALFALARVVDLCLRDYVPLLAAGDLFDGPAPEPEALSAAYEVLRPLDRAGLHVYYILGNHDRNCDWFSPMGPFAVNVDGVTVGLPKGKSLTGLSYLPAENFKAAAAKTRPTDIGLYHQTWLEFNPYGKSTVTDLPAHQLAVCGDTHVRSLINPPRGPKTALSTGPLSPRAVNEFMPPVAFAVTDDMSVTPVSIPGRKYILLEVSDEVSAEAALVAAGKILPDPSLPATVSKPVVAIKMAAGCRLDPSFEETAARLMADRGFLLRVSEQTSRKTAAGPKKAEAYGSSGLAAALATWACSPAARELAVELTSPGANPGQILSDHRVRIETKLETADQGTAENGED